MGFVELKHRPGSQVVAAQQQVLAWQFRIVCMMLWREVLVQYGLAGEWSRGRIQQQLCFF